MIELPKIGVVIIGVNVSRYIGDCIRSVRAADYPQELITIAYVDGGSTDDSAHRALAAGDIQLIELNDLHPTPGRGRNAGWKAMTTPLIQFLDADTLIDPKWFRKAIVHFEGNIVAVCGGRKERYPKKNFFHRLTELEWRYEIGLCRYFGGDVLLRRQVLEETKGFDESLVAGEDPELSYRIRHLGYQILRLDAPMTTHDINMSSLRQYFKRAFRSGYAYAEIGIRFMKNQEKMWQRELIRITATVLLQLGILLAGSAMGYSRVALGLAILVFLRPFFRLGKVCDRFDVSLPMGLLYAAHTSIVIYPQFFGVVRYLAGRILERPLQNRGIASHSGGVTNAQ